MWQVPEALDSRTNLQSNRSLCCSSHSETVVVTILEAVAEPESYADEEHNTGSCEAAQLGNHHFHFGELDG